MSTVTGDPHNGPFIAGQLGILADTIDDARHVLKGGEAVVGGRWWEDHLQSTVCLYCPPTHKIGLDRHQTHTKMNFFPAPMLAWGSSERVRSLLHYRLGVGFNPTYPHARTGRTVFLIHHRVHLAPTGAFAGTTASRWGRSDVWVGGGGSHGTREGQSRESGSEPHFAYDKVERLGAWNSGWQIVIGVGYGICIKISREKMGEIQSVSV